MNLSRFLGVLLAAASTLLVAACAGGESEDALDQDDWNVPLHPAAGGERPPPSGTNGLLPSCFWSHGAQQALRTLGAAALDSGDGFIPAIAPSLVPESCRQVIESAVACALPRGHVLRDPVTGADYEGRWGLAPSWSTGALSTDGRRYVTACLVQRLNITGAPVPILLEGPHPAIAETEALGSLYPIEESTAFGDLFSSGTPLLGLLPAFNVFVCWEDLLPQSCGLLGLPVLFEERVCDDLPLCGLVALGPCSLVCADNGPYRKCKPGLLAPWWTQTVRVQLEEATCH